MKKKITLITVFIVALAIVGIVALEAYTSSDSYRKQEAGEAANTEHIESSPSSEQVDETNELADIVEDDNSIETEACECASDELPRLIMINDELYYDTAEEIDKVSCGTMDGTIETSQSGSKGIPTENNSSNFGIGYGWQYGTEDTIEVYIDDRWCVFRKYEKGLIEVLDKALEN